MYWKPNLIKLVSCIAFIIYAEISFNQKKKKTEHNKGTADLTNFQTFK